MFDVDFIERLLCKFVCDVNCFEVDFVGMEFVMWQVVNKIIKNKVFEWNLKFMFEGIIFIGQD